MISFSRISTQYGKQILFVDASFQINPGEKVGFFGQNGIGQDDARGAGARGATHGLGFEDDQSDADAGALSGGWKMRVAMARVRLGRSDVLLTKRGTGVMGRSLPTPAVLAIAVGIMLVRYVGRPWQ